jgi:hypothetical protein
MEHDRPCVGSDLFCTLMYKAFADVEIMRAVLIKAAQMVSEQKVNTSSLEFCSKLISF